MSRKLLLIGGGGHCKSVLDSVLKLNIFAEIGIIDLPENVGKLVLGKAIIGNDSDLPAFKNAGFTDAFITLGSIGYADKRIAAQEVAENIGFSIPNIIDPTAIIGEQVDLGKGIFIGKNAVVNAGVTIDNGAVINTGAIVEHDCKIGSFAHISPGAVICGNVIIGDRTHIGAGSMVRQGTIIGDNVVIGLGSVVVNDIASRVIAYGNPCKVVKPL